MPWWAFLIAWLVQSALIYWFVFADGSALDMPGWGGLALAAFSAALLTASIGYSIGDGACDMTVGRSGLACE